jgi:hypothetical protein
MWHAWERREKCTRFWWESQKERDRSEDQGVDGRMGSEWILGRLALGCGLDSAGSGQGPVAGCCECGDEPSGSCATKLVSAIYTDIKDQFILLSMKQLNGTSLLYSLVSATMKTNASS